MTNVKVAPDFELSVIVRLMVDSVPLNAHSLVGRASPTGLAWFLVRGVYPTITSQVERSEPSAYGSFRYAESSLRFDPDRSGFRLRLDLLIESHTTLLDCQDDRALGRVAILVIAEQAGRAFVAPRGRNLIANRRFIGSARPPHRRRHQPERVIAHRG